MKEVLRNVRQRKNRTVAIPQKQKLKFIMKIKDAGKGLRMDFGYGPDRQRWYSELLSNGKVSRTTVYAGEYEKTTNRSSRISQMCSHRALKGTNNLRKL